MGFSVIALIREDSHLSRLSKMLEGSVYNVDFSEYENEIVAIQKTRSIRSISDKRFTQHFEETIIAISLENTRNRARLSEIHLQLSLKANKLGKHISDVNTYLRTTYASNLKKQYKTVKERDVAIDSVLHEATGRQSQFQSLLKVIEFILNDIDKAGFGLNQIINTADIKSRNRHMKIGK